MTKRKRGMRKMNLEVEKEKIIQLCVQLSSKNRGGREEVRAEDKREREIEAS